MQKYTFAEDAIFKGKGSADPDVVGEIIARIQRSAKVPLTTAMWKAAEGNPDHPLYPHYDWDLRTAAEAHWEDQSRAIIRAVRVVDEEKPEQEPIRAFHSIVTPDQPRQYYTTREVKRSADLQISLLRQAQRDLLAFERRYRELIDICVHIKSARELVEKKLGVFEESTPA